MSASTFHLTQRSINISISIFQALWLLKLATAARRKALDWTNEAIDMIMTVLARTEANQFVDLLISGFGFEDPGLQEEEGASKEPKTTDPSKYKSAVKRATEGTSEEPLAKRLRSSAAEEAKYFKEEALYPLESENIKIVKAPNRKALLHAGVPDIFSYRIKEGNDKGSYGCAYQEVAISQGLPVDEKECHFIASNKVGVTIHLRRCHLGVALQCPICQKTRRYYDANYWRRHMEEKHQDIPEDQWYA